VDVKFVNRIDIRDYRVNISKVRKRLSGSGLYLKLYYDPSDHERDGPLIVSN